MPGNGGNGGKPGLGASPGKMSIHGFKGAPKFNLFANEGEDFQSIAFGFEKH